MNISAAARALETTQPNISRYIRMLEEELSIRIFRRARGKLTGVTKEGVAVVDMIDSILGKVDGMYRLAQDLKDDEAGALTIGCSDVFAGHLLPQVVAEFRRQFPDVAVNVLRGSSTELQRFATEGYVDFALVTEHTRHTGELVMLHGARHYLTVVVPEGHALGQQKRLTLGELAEYPLATYVQGHAGRQSIDEAFAVADVVPKVVFTSNDADLIKSHVRTGGGVGVICQSACMGERDDGLKFLNADSLFNPVTVYVCLRRDSMMRGYGYRFIELLAPHLRQEYVKRVMAQRDSAQAFDLMGQDDDGGADDDEPRESEKSWAHSIISEEMPHADGRRLQAV